MTGLTHPKLMPDERVVWHSCANWDRAAKPPRRAYRLLATLGVTTLVSLLAVVIIAVEPTGPASIARALYSVIILAVAGGVVYAVGRSLAVISELWQSDQPRSPAEYWLTDRRLICITGCPPTTTVRVVTRNADLLVLTTTPNGAVTDVVVWFWIDDNRDDDRIVTLHALTDARRAERALLQVFGVPAGPRYP
ncbi:MAG: hypothetical protein AAGC71_18085 [Pseudomonadota bacterium]